MEIEQSYEIVHKEKDKASILVVEEKGVPWFYDITKFLELVVYLDGANKRERHSIRIMALQHILYGGQLYRRYSSVMTLLMKQMLRPTSRTLHLSWSKGQA